MADFFYPVQANDLRVLDIWFSVGSTSPKPNTRSILGVLNACANHLEVFRICYAIDIVTSLPDANDASIPVTKLNALRQFDVTEYGTEITMLFDRLIWPETAALRLNIQLGAPADELSFAQLLTDSAKQVLFLIFLKLCTSHHDI